MRSAWIAAIVVVAVISTIVLPRRLLLVWNVTPSSPIGLYSVTRAMPKRGDLVVTRLPPGLEALAVSRAILSYRTPVLKRVVATTGDVVCRVGIVITINGRLAAIARRHDRQQRELPVWHGCHRLSTAQIFLLGTHPDSFDGRYHGPIEISLALGIAAPLLTFGS